MNAAVFLDRDDTLIHNDGDLGDPELVSMIQGASSAIASLRGLGYKIVVVSNQGGVARGKYTEADVEAVHRRINEVVKATSGATIDKFYYCPYHPEGTVERYRREHPWRKPQAGMLLQAAKDLDIDLTQSWMVGDQMRDIQAGAAAGVTTILLRQDAEELTPLQIEAMAAAAPGADGQVMPNFSARSLIEAVRIIAQKRKPETPEEIRARERANKKWDAGSARSGRPAREPEAATPPSKPAGHGASKPFRPWGAPPLEAPGSSADAPQTQRPEADPPPVSVSAPAVPQESPVKPSPRPENPDAQIEMLRQILQELRGQRGAGSDFSYAKIMAIIFQMIALVCLLGALWMGRENVDIFLRWLGSGLILQLMAIAALLFGR